jgi:serine/threonine-protein kinase
MGLTTQTFDIITRIAVGNGALVYRAVEKSSLRQVALKLLTKDGELDHRLDLDALFTDAPRLKSIYGAHVCQLLDAYSDEDGPVLVYEYANGLNGAEFPSQRKLDATQALDVAAQLISALRSGERQRTPHGDLKPSNIIFVDLPEGRPFAFVLDWGLAAYRSKIPDDSLFFLSPERLAGGPPSHAADLFAAGSILFYLYTGKVLVTRDTYEQVAIAWRGVRPSVLAELRPDLPPKLVHWICSLLELDPAKRPASAVEASTALAALNPPPPPAPPETIRPRPPSAPQPTRLPAPSSAPSSVILPVPQRSGVRPAPAPSAPAPRPGAIPPKKKSMLPSILLGALTAAALAGGGIYWVMNQKKKVVEPAAMEDNRPSRPASESVSAPVEKPTPRALPNAVPATPSSPPSVARNGSQKSAAKPAEATAPAVPPAQDGPFFAIESFAYPSGSPLAGQNGGSGWAGAWQGPPPAKVEGASLSYPAHPATGGSITIDETNEELLWSRTVGSASRFLPQPGKGGHWYFGMLIEHHSGLPTPGGEIHINPFDTKTVHNLIRIVIADAGDSTKVTLNNEKAVVEVKNDGKPICLVMRIEAKNPKFDNYDIQARLWVNPDFSKPRPQPHVECEVKYQPLPQQLGVLIRKKRSQAVTHLDELRYGRHWPEMAFLKGDKDGDD